jgi:hypothetical protein
MDAAALGARVARRLTFARGTPAVLGVFSGTLFLSAMLLFSVQPMFARMVLPQLGGSPSVWAVAMCFFQAVLLAGYCYAHLLNRLAPTNTAPFFHLCLLGAAVLMLPIGLPEHWPEPPAGDAYVWLIGLLCAGVGVPFFAVSANAPFLHAWLARSGHPHAADPYFLYGASNLGSLIALLAYPVMLEPFMGLKAQAIVWAWGFLALGLLVAACGLMSLAGEGEQRLSVADDARADAARPTWRERLEWICLALVPSGLLVAFTSYVTTDIASAPFLWVIPLAMFLGTFILVFRGVPLIPHRTMLLLQPLLVVAVFVGISTTGSTGWFIATLAGTFGFFVTTMVCHRELYNRRPASLHLTEFYLWMSFGGVLGGVFAALVAPQLFNAIWEFPLLLVLGMVLRPGLLVSPKRRDAMELAGFALVVLAFMVLINAGLRASFIAPWQGDLMRVVIIAGSGALALLNTSQPLRQLACISVAAMAIVVLPSAMNRGDAERSFFGVHRVVTSPDGELRTLLHGTTIHGAQRIRDAEGRPIDKPLPMAYYHPGAPMTRGVEMARRGSGKSGPEFRAGVVGLGAGVMACNAKAGERWRFYEIDPVVVKIASNPEQFSFLSTCLPGADMVVGDARLTVARESNGSFDFLLIDAFASDAIPVHLLTREAIALYLEKLTPDGILALHVSNRHLDLHTIASATAKALPGTLVGLADDRVKGKGLEAASSHVVFVTRSARAFDQIKTLPYVSTVDEIAVTPWTDDFSNIISALWRKARG